MNEKVTNVGENRKERVTFKPAPLKGGSEVFQKLESNFWFCNINIDEFVFIYTEDLDENYVQQIQCSTKEQEQLKYNFLKAVEKKTEKGFWISSYEPCMYKGKIRFIKGEKPLVRMDCLSWNIYLKYYSMINGSKMATKSDYFLVGLRLLKDGLVKIEELADDSSSIGNFWESKNPGNYNFEPTGTRNIAGICGFIGNTCKIVRDDESSSGYSRLGGSVQDYGSKTPFAFIEKIRYESQITIDSVAILRLDYQED